MVIPIPKRICVHSTTPDHKPKTILVLVMLELLMVLPESTAEKVIVNKLVDVSVHNYTQTPLHVTNVYNHRMSLICERSLSIHVMLEQY